VADEKVENQLNTLLKQDTFIPQHAQVDIKKCFKDYKLLIHKMAHKYVRHRVEYDDLIQEAFVGLVLACRDFNPERSTDFHTYAIYRIKGKMYEYCIGNENPIYVPTHVAKAASYVKQMQRLLDREPGFTGGITIISEIIAVTKHEAEGRLNEAAQIALSELKRKLGNIAGNSKVTYERLAGMAMESLSIIVSDDVLAKHPEESGIVEDIVSNRELGEQLRDALGERRFTVLSMRALGWNYREIAERLEELGYVNKQGKQITRQAVKAILDETLKAVRKMRIIKSIKY